MRLVKVGANHYINADRMIEVYPHLVEPGLTIVMAAPQADASSDDGARVESEVHARGTLQTDDEC